MDLPSFSSTDFSGLLAFLALLSFLGGFVALTLPAHITLDLGAGIWHKLGFRSHFAGKFLLELGQEFIAGFNDGFLPFDDGIFNQEATGNSTQEAPGETFDAAMSDIGTHRLHESEGRVGGTDQAQSHRHSPEAEDSGRRQSSVQTYTQGLIFELLRPWTGHLPQMVHSQ